MNFFKTLQKQQNYLIEFFDLNLSNVLPQKNNQEIEELSMKIFGYDLSKHSKPVQLIICLFGIIFLFLVYGFIQVSRLNRKCSQSNLFQYRKKYLLLKGLNLVGI